MLYARRFVQPETKGSPRTHPAMISNPNTAPADAYAPDADRAGPAMPEGIARLLTVVRVLLGYGRHLAATIEHRATQPGFWLFSAVFGTARLPVILAHIHRGILRAATLEALLLKRAAAGRDVAAPRPTHATPGTDTNADPWDEPADAQIARLTAERAQHDAPVDPDHPAAAEQIEAEVRARPIGRTIADIRRDLGIIANLCTRAFWDALADAIAGYEDSTVAWLVDTQPQSDGPRQEQEANPAPEQMARGACVCRRPTSGGRFAARPLVPFRDQPARAWPRHNVPESHGHPGAATPATGPPLGAAMRLAA